MVTRINSYNGETLDTESGVIKRRNVMALDCFQRTPDMDDMAIREMAAIRGGENALFYDEGNRVQVYALNGSD